MQLSRFLTNPEKSIGKQLNRAYASYEAQRKRFLIGNEKLELNEECVGTWSHLLGRVSSRKRVIE